MTSQAPERPKTFTLQHANASLPLVRAIVTDLVELARDVEERRRRLSTLLGGRDESSDDVYSEELLQMRDELENDAERLREYVNELQELGVEPKDPFMGLVDFPCMMDGRIVYLCWKLGEPEILYWHELDGGFAGRQPITPAELSSSELN